MSSELSTLPGLRQSRRAGFLHGILVRRLLRLMAPAQAGRLVVNLPNGEHIQQVGSGAGVEATLSIATWQALWQALVRGSNGLAEGYMRGHWSSPDLPRLMEWLAANRDALTQSSEGTIMARLLDRLHHASHANTRRNSRRNIAAHYDLGNAFYAEWLDAGMNYSSGIYAHEGVSLEGAQTAKIDAVCDLLELSTPSRVLEVGCGWGCVMETLVRRGHHVTGLTLSHEQQAWAKQRLAAAAPSGGWDVRLEDYRDAGGSFDRIVSIEMVEAVGEAYWPLYFTKLYERLRPGGVAVIQAITIEADRYDYYRRNPDFIQRYIFPGGMLPTREILQAQALSAGLSVGRSMAFGTGYAETLKDWRLRFLAAWPRIEPMGFDLRFKRMWEYYLAYCEAGFRQKALDVHLIQMRKPE